MKTTRERTWNTCFHKQQTTYKSNLADTLYLETVIQTLPSCCSLLLRSWERKDEEILPDC